MEGALEIQKRMMDRLSSKYGFCDPEVMFQKLERELKMYDIESSGLLGILMFLCVSFLLIT